MWKFLALFISTLVLGCATDARVMSSSLENVPDIPPYPQATREQLDANTKAILQLVGPFEEIIDGELLKAFLIAYDELRRIARERESTLEPRLVAFERSKEGDSIFVRFTNKKFLIRDIYGKDVEEEYQCLEEPRYYCYVFGNKTVYRIEVSRTTMTVVSVDTIPQ